MDFCDFNTGKDDISRRLDKVIRIFASNMSLPEIYKAIRKGLIKVNNKKTKSDYRIQENDKISIASFLINKKDDDIVASQSSCKKNLPMPDIVFQNEHILIVNKPYNVNVHGDSDSLDKIVENYFANLSETNNSLSFKPGPLHRLDKKTTGLLAFSLSLEGAHWFTENIQNHIIQKKYFGLAEGHIDAEENWTDYIEKDNEHGNSFHKVTAKSTKQSDSSEKAETIATPIAYGKFKGNPVTLVEYNIKTGRKHQIRSQSALHGHPLLGDTAYNCTLPPASPWEFYLTAKELTFPKDNPINLPEKLSIPLPSQFKLVLKRCGIEKADV